MLVLVLVLVVVVVVRTTFWFGSVCVHVQSGDKVSLLVSLLVS